MACAWQGTLENGLTLKRKNEFVNSVLHGYQKSFGAPQPQLVGSWKKELPFVLNVLNGHLSKDIHVIIEYQLPFNGMRADLVLLGTCFGNSAAHIVELKSWDSSNIDQALPTFVNVGTSLSVHPSYQAANYAGKLRFFHTIAKDWDISASALVKDKNKEKHLSLKNSRFENILDNAPLFIPEEEENFANHVGSKLPDPPIQSTIASFLDGEYTQSLRLFEAIKNNQENIQKSALGSLASNGIGLSEEQLFLCEKILSASAYGRRVFLIKGGSGSGKTLVAIYLLIQSLAHGKRTILALRNNRLMASLKKVLESSIIGMSGALKYFSTPQRTGVEDLSANAGPVDLLICDEGQRLTLREPTVFTRASKTVILYDDDQILNLEEGGFRDQLEESAHRVGANVEDFDLPTPFRCRGGKAYTDWVETLLTSPSNIQGSPCQQGISYSLSSANSSQDLIEELRQLNSKYGYRVALVAAFTRSSGRSKLADKNDLGKLRIPETNPQIDWLMDPMREYAPFWVTGLSNQLTSCASIYGAQGFESDYVGLVWGNDLVIRDRQWEVGSWQNCYDTVGRPSLRNLLQEGHPDAMRLLKNRYRIFLTRGILGTILFSEDDETQRYFSNLFT